MRNLASIQRIKSLEPIGGADNIEKATVLGWHLVVKKGEFQVGGLVVYCEVDSVLPEREEFEFLRPRKFRIRTIKLRGQVSQGICFPTSILPEGFEVEEGKDCTEALGIVKYEPPIPACLTGVMKGNFPEFIPKTDETRVQVLQPLLDRLAGTPCYIAEKLDGSSATFYLKDGVFGVCSRNIDLLESEDNSFWKAAREMQIEEKLREYGKNIALQGELIGEGIQGNKLGVRGQTVFFFNVFDIDSFKYLGYKQFMLVAHQLILPTVPIIEDNYKLSGDIDELVELSQVRSLLNNKVWAEGIVIRPVEEQMDMFLSSKHFNSGRVSFKVINPKFLLKYE